MVQSFAPVKVFRSRVSLRRGNSPAAAIHYREASIALGSLAPDREPRKGGITKELSVSSNVLNVRWTADEARILRVSVGSFLDNLALVLETMEQFGPPVPL
ncbi:EKC/KEOPS complex subunit LAGE3-like [Arapaima gigas]